MYAESTSLPGGFVRYSIDNPLQLQIDRRGDTPTSFMQPGGLLAPAIGAKLMKILTIDRHLSLSCARERHISRVICEPAFDFNY